jgi:hypothetical protein
MPHSLMAIVSKCSERARVPTHINESVKFCERSYCPTADSRLPCGCDLKSTRKLRGNRGVPACTHMLPWPRPAMTAEKTWVRLCSHVRVPAT